MTELKQLESLSLVRNRREGASVRRPRRRLLRSRTHPILHSLDGDSVQGSPYRLGQVEK